MAVFDQKSRYVVPPLEPYVVLDKLGREVKALPMVEPRIQNSAGQYVKKQGQRLDHLSNSFLDDPHGYWRLCDVNEVMLPDALSEIERIKIPTSTG